MKKNQAMKKKAALKVAMISVRVPAALKDATERAAAADHRSVAAYVEIALRNQLRADGFLPEGSASLRAAKPPATEA